VKDYILHYRANYSKVEVRTWDGVVVKFEGAHFYHLFYEDNDRDGNKDQFSWQRAEHINWIKQALQDFSATHYQGWNNKHKRYDPTRRLVVAEGNYVVVIQLLSDTKAFIVTHFFADNPTLAKIRLSPLWKGFNKP
jgi:hypothetical protein